MKGFWIFISIITAVIIGLFALSKSFPDFKFSFPVNLFKAQPAPLSPAVNSAASGAKSSASAVTAQNKILRVSYVKPANSYNKYTEVALTASLPKGEFLDVTGWTVKTNRGGFFKIPKAQEVYHFGGAEQEILVKSGDKIVMYPFSGLIGNFALNKCTGYLETAMAFTPSLPKNCPIASRTELASFSGRCQNYITSLRTCQIPSANPPVPYDDSACRNFLDSMTYEGCVNKHKDDSDFRSGEWRLWVGPTMNIFDEFHDKVQIFDLYGNLVSEYTY